METFIIRVWTPSPDLANEVLADELRGSMEHVRSRESSQFVNGDDLLEIVRLVVASVGQSTPDENSDPH